MQENNRIVVELILAFTLLLSILGAFFFVLINKYYLSLKKREKESLNNLIVGQNIERERISRDIHDELGPILACVIFDLDKIDFQNPSSYVYKNNSKREIKLIINKLRDLSHDLMPDTLIKYGLFYAADELMDKYRINHVILTCESNCRNIELSKFVITNLYMILQELLYNTNKHSGAKNISLFLNLNAETNEFVFKYQDDGKGFSSLKQIVYGIGLNNIITRARLINGEIKINGERGFFIEIKIKLC